MLKILLGTASASEGGRPRCPSGVGVRAGRLEEAENEQHISEDWGEQGRSLGV